MAPAVPAVVAAAVVPCWSRVEVKTFMYPSSLELASRAALVKMTLRDLSPDWSMILEYGMLAKSVDHCIVLSLALP